MVDTHCHLLPGLDDGPAGDDQAYELAQALAGIGVRHVVCTPHYSSRFASAHEVATGALRRLAALVSEASIPLELSVAAEVSPTRAVTAPLSDLRQRAIAARFLLVELLPSTPAPFPTALLDRLHGTKLVPILAHPERCRAIQRAPSLLDEARRRGALSQVVATSLMGMRGREIAAAGWRIVNSGRADLVASDAHTGPDAQALAQSADLIAAQLGRAVSDALTRRRPAEVVAGRHPGEES